MEFREYYNIEHVYYIGKSICSDINSTDIDIDSLKIRNIIKQNIIEFNEKIFYDINLKSGTNGEIEDK
jgi:hypothetical protein